MLLKKYSLTASILNLSHFINEIKQETRHHVPVNGKTKYIKLHVASMYKFVVQNIYKWIILCINNSHFFTMVFIAFDLNFEGSILAPPVPKQWKHTLCVLPYFKRTVRNRTMCHRIYTAFTIALNRFFTNQWGYLWDIGYLKSDNIIEGHYYTHCLLWMYTQWKVLYFLANNVPRQL